MKFRIKLIVLFFILTSYVGAQTSQKCDGQSGDDLIICITNQLHALQEEVKSLKEPAYESEWLKFSSQAGPASYMEQAHGLDTIPSKVEVLIRAVDGPIKGYIFQGSGMAMNDDDDGTTGYGGVVFAYNERSVKLWAPDKSNNETLGRIIYIADGWGGEINAHSSNNAEVKIKVWR